MEAQRLRALFGPCRILLVLRAQPDWVQSWYLYDTRPDNVPFDQWLDGERDCYRDVRMFAHLDYDTLHRFYTDLFGEDRVRVLLFEELRDDASSFLTKLSDFIGIDPDRSIELMEAPHHNRSRTARYRRYKKLRRFLSHRISLAKPLPGPVVDRIRRFLQGGSKPKIPPDTREEIADRYRSTNRRLMERLDLPLDEHGYPI